MITVFLLKGGVGKTSLAFLLAKSLDIDMPVITNDIFSSLRVTFKPEKVLSYC